MVIEPEEERPPFGNEDEEDEGGPVKSFLEHLEDLRWVLIKCIAALGVATLICLIGGNRVVAILKHPLEKAQARYASDVKIAVFLYGTNRLGTYTLDLDQWDALVTPAGRTNGWRLATNDITNLKSLVGKFEKPDSEDKTASLSKLISSNLSSQTRGLMTNFDAGTKRQGLLKLFQPTAEEQQRFDQLAANLTRSLVDDLNRVIESGSIYDEKRFEDITLSPGTAALVDEHLQGPDLFQFNRRLLLHAYPGEITSDGRRFIAVYLEPKSDGTNLVLALRVDKGKRAEALAKHVNVDLNTLSPAGGFFVAFQVAIYGGIAVSSPLLFYFIAQFVFPALKWRERRYVYRGMFFFIPLFIIGACFCYFLLLPVALAASQIYSNWLGFSANIWQAEEYISFVSKFILGMGLGFEMPVVILVLVKIGILNYSMLARGRRYMILINLILGALLTTPEVLTQILMAVPLQLLYEISVWIAWYWERKEKKRLAAEEAAERTM
ncbi:MAG TPA: twin-arginine translocase subunit TatC [Verrucomicrobiae bacterium]|nr:twin-arginine translocase subunit TatC [Verrucomicrobiae bacterium]